MITNDVGELFAVMQAAYAQRWTHGADAIPVWLGRLQNCRREDVMRAADKWLGIDPDWPPSLGRFAALVQESTPALPAPKSQFKQPDPDRIYAYTKPESKTNPKGNPHHVSLPESIAHRYSHESAEDYRKRISDAMTFAMYPNLGPDGRHIPEPWR